MPQLISNNYFARIDSIGTNDAPDSNNNQGASITQLSTGGFVVAWETSGVIWAQIYDANGDVTGDPFELISTGFSSPTNVSLAALPNGGFIAVWESVQTPDDSFVGVGVQIFDSSGLLVGDPFTANTTVEGTQQQPSVTVLASGNFVVSWTVGDDGNGPGIVAQLFDPSGGTIGNEFSVNSATVGDQHYSRTISLPSGGFVIAWADSWDEQTSFQVYDASANPVGNQVNFAGGTGSIFDIAVLPSGNFVIVMPTNTGDLAGQVYSGSGIAVGSPFEINSPTDGTEILPSIAVLPSGEFVVSWRAPTDGVNFFQIGDVVAQRFSSSGVKIGEQFVVSATADGESDPQITSFGTNDIAVVYTHYDQAGVPHLDLQLFYSTIVGTAAGEILSGDAGKDFIYGNGGDDILKGLDGDDYLSGLGGDDILQGGSGNDTLNGGVGLDKMYGGVGDDIYVVTDATDYAYENVGEGTDLVQSSVSLALRANVENLTLTGSGGIFGYGNELANALTGNGGSNKLFGLAGDDVLVGGGGNDKLFGGEGTDQLSGGAGDDFYYIDDALDTVVELAGQGSDRVYASLSYVLDADVEYLTLTGTADLDGTGNASANFLYGNSGSNTLLGLGGDDYLFAGSGHDVLDGGAGGVDKMWGGTGDDVYYVHDAADYAYEYAGEGHDTVYSDVNLTLRNHVEDLVLAGSADLWGKGNDEANAITGNSGANKLFGLVGDDVLDGAGGDDLVEGGAGRDVMGGGTGADRFTFNNGDFAGMGEGTADRILDFSQADGDRIRLSAVDANLALGGDQAFSFIGGNAFTNVAGQLRYEQIAGNTYVMGDTNGDGNADFWIRLDGLHSLNGGDFIL